MTLKIIQTTPSLENHDQRRFTVMPVLQGKEGTQYMKYKTLLNISGLSNREAANLHCVSIHTVNSYAIERNYIPPKRIEQLIKYIRTQPELMETIKQLQSMDSMGE